LDISQRFIDRFVEDPSSTARRDVSSAAIDLEGIISMSAETAGAARIRHGDVASSIIGGGVMTAATNNMLKDSRPLQLIAKLRLELRILKLIQDGKITGADRTGALKAICGSTWSGSAAEPGNGSH
jgi:hypothetical protein